MLFVARTCRGADGVWCAALAAALVVAVPSPVAAQYEQKLARLPYETAADASYTLSARYEVRATNESAARQIAQQTIVYSESMEDLQIVEAHTFKADGTKLPVDTTAI